MGILVVGSVAIDAVATPFGRRDEALGGSATYFSVAASKFGAVDIVAVVGTDFPKKYISLLQKKGIGTDGLMVSPGKTFRWKGTYGENLNVAHTIYTHLNVFKTFNPQVPDHLRRPEILFLANIDPDLQLSVLRQVSVRPKMIACDSMNLWIDIKRAALIKLLKKIDVVFLNDAEVRQLSGEDNIIKAAQYVAGHGPHMVIVKRGEHGVACFTKNGVFIAPAYLLDTLKDPTGAGDSFAGGMIGYLSTRKKIDDSALRKSIIYGSVIASFTVQDFSVDRLLTTTRSDIERRFARFKQITRF